jgi:hypothetical protein
MISDGGIQFLVCISKNKKSLKINKSWNLKKIGPQFDKKKLQKD